MPIQTALDSIGNNQGSPFGFKNRIINGGMVIDQRNAGSSGTAVGYHLDRWGGYHTQSSKYTWQRNAGSVTPPPGFTNYLGYTSSSSYSVISSDLFEAWQLIEGYNIADFAWGSTNAKTVTVSFWVRSSLTGTFSFTITNSGQSYSYPTGYTINQANTWEYKTITISGPTTGTWDSTNGAGLLLIFGLGKGSSFDASSDNAWTSTQYARSASGKVNLVGTNGATWYVTGVQLEVGKQATSFDYRPYGTEFQLCQRYFQSYGRTAGSNSMAGRLMSSTNSSGNAICGFTLPVTMRANPSAVFYGGGSTTGNLGVNYAGSTSTVSLPGAISYTSTHTQAVAFNLSSSTTANITAWLDMGLYANAFGLELSAEL